MPPFGCLPCFGPPPPPRLKLHVDANRDGNVDNRHAGVHQWTWGGHGRGAIILCNNNDDNASRIVAPLVPNAGVPQAQTLEIPAAVGGLDHTDQAVDGANDVSDIAPLEIRRHPHGRVFQANWSGQLRVLNGREQYIRIFNARAAGAAEIIGPAAGAVHLIPNLDTAPAIMAFGMEATAYPVGAFDGYIDLVIDTLTPGGGVHHSHTARVRVAPWVATHHLNRVEQVFVASHATPEHAAFRNDLTTGTNSAAIPAHTLAPTTIYDNDIWFRDVMKLGFSTLPRTTAPATRHSPVALRTANDRDQSHGGLLDRFIWRSYVGQQGGYVSPQAHPFINGSSLDSFGNLDCSPPVTVNGRNYKFGRIIYGDPMARPGVPNPGRMSLAVRRFLIDQQVQAPFAVDSGWLDVGHIDEVFSFCPWPTAPKKFKLLMASPNEALQILNQAVVNGHGAAPLCGGPQASPHWPHAAASHTLLTVNQVLGNAAFVNHQATVQGYINSMENTLRAELGLVNNDIIKLPVLYRDTGAGASIAYLPNAVNMLVVTKANGYANLCIPKPFGPVVLGQCLFEQDILAKLAPAYQPAAPVAPPPGEIHFIDDFFTYHQIMGEVHCGTNEQRAPATDRWWWELGWMT